MAMMNPTVMRNLTMASAKHLLSAGHISKAHHAKIMKSNGSLMGAPAAPKAPGAMAPGPKLPKMAAGGPPPMAVPMGALDAQQPQQPGMAPQGMPQQPEE